MESLRIALAGYGEWTREALIPSLERDGRARIVAAAARTPATRERIRSELGSQVALHSDFADLFDEAVDALILALPSSLHAEGLLAAIESGLPFFHEPPVADHRDRVRPVLRRLLATEQVTHADMELRFIPVIIRAAQRVAEGAIGEPRTAMIRMRGSWSPDPTSGISLMHSLSPWYIDALDQVLGASPKRVLVQEGRGYPGRMQSYALTQLDYGGVWGSFDANISAVPGMTTTLEVTGTEGDLQTDLFTAEIRLRTLTRPEPEIERVPALEPYAGWPGMCECVAAFLDAVSGLGPERAGARAVARSHLAGLAGERSIDTGTWAEVEGLEDLE